MLHLINEEHIIDLFGCRRLGIEMLGGEILATLNILYGKDQLYGKAQDLDLYKMEDVVAQTFAPTVLDLAGSESFPGVRGLV